MGQGFHSPQSSVIFFPLTNKIPRASWDPKEVSAQKKNPPVCDESNKFLNNRKKNKEQNKNPLQDIVLHLGTKLTLSSISANLLWWRESSDSASANSWSCLNNSPPPLQQLKNMQQPTINSAVQ